VQTSSTINSRMETLPKLGSASVRVSATGGGKQSFATLDRNDAIAPKAVILASAG